MKTTSLFRSSFLLLLICTASICGARASNPGLSVENGTFLKDGQPYRAIGVNYFDLFSRILEKPRDTSSLSNLTVLAREEIPFVRFMCGGYWPSSQQMFFTNRPIFFERLDQVLRCAETNKIGLIPSLFWFFATIPDLAGEPIDQLGNPDSKSIALIREYTTAIVTRYRNSPAIWGWEFGNEYNLECDLPNHPSHRPPIQPALGTPSSRGERDELEFRHLQIALQAFSETVKNLDPARPIFTGNAVPRASAWNNLHHNSWTPDSAAQFAEILRRDNPDPIDTITIHVYPEASGSYPGATKSITELLGLANAVATKAAKPLFLGEFGVSSEIGSREQQENALAEYLDAIEEHRIPLSAFWVFDYAPQSKNYSVDAQDGRRFILEAIKRRNAQWRASPQ